MCNLHAKTRLNFLQGSVNIQKSIQSAVLKDELLKVKYHFTQTTFVILQLFDCVTDVTADCAYAIGSKFCEKFFTSKFQVCA